MNRAAQAKKFLNSYREAHEQLMECKERIDTLREKQRVAASPRLSGMPKANQHIDLSDYIVRLELLIEEYEKKYNIEKATMKEVRTAIERLCSDKDRQILSYKYIDFMNYAEIAEATGMELGTIYDRHERALGRLIWKNL